MSSHKEVRYVVSRLKNPDDLDGGREPIAWHSCLDLAKKHADRIGAGACVDAQGGTYRSGGPHSRHGCWQAEWTNRNLYQSRTRRGPLSEI